MQKIRSDLFFGVMVLVGLGVIVLGLVLVLSGVF